MADACHGKCTDIVAALSFVVVTVFSSDCGICRHCYCKPGVVFCLYCAKALMVCVLQFSNDDVLAVTAANCIVALIIFPAALYSYFLTWKGSEYVARGRYDLYQVTRIHNRIVKLTIALGACT